MNSLSRTIVAVAAIAATTPALLATPAAAAPLTGGIVTAPVTTTTSMTLVRSTFGLCHIFPKLCPRAASWVGGQLP